MFIISIMGGVSQKFKLIVLFSGFGIMLFSLIDLRS